jgi:signal transduction histidine kinase
MRRSLDLSSFHAVRRHAKPGVAVHGYGHDTSARMQDCLREAETRQAVGQLAAGVAHDFNNLLTIILGNLELLAETASGDDAEHISAAQHAARRMTHATVHLQSYAGLQVQAASPVDVAAMLGDVQALLHGMLPPDVMISTDIDRGVSRVHVDCAQLRAALVDLGVNAAGAMPHGGQLCFEAYDADSTPGDGLLPGRYVVVAATDSGEGMAPEVTARVFEPFAGAHRMAGTGLALPTARGFARRAGGDVQVISVIGFGTRVELWLPVLTANKTPHEAPMREMASATAAPPGFKSTSG